MEYSGGDERIAFGPMAKGQKKYGATSSRFKKHEQLVVYNVQLGDTLQGLAVKFGVTVRILKIIYFSYLNEPKARTRESQRYL